jgi:glycosyltransferase involved in cell wall biosynthesis
MPKLCIDGFNIALPKGSGIATYGRNLLTNARQIGLVPQVLYGSSTPKNDSNVLNETSLADVNKAPRKLKKIERFARTAMSRFPRQAWSVSPSGEVIWPTGAGGRPDADSYWAVEDLFGIAHRAFNAYGTHTPVSFRDNSALAPDVMQWTSTVPLYAKGVPNIYTIHDLIPLRLPHTTADNKAKYLELCKAIAARADHIAVVSETTRQDVIRILGVGEDRVTNTYQSVSIPENLAARPESDLVLELEGIFQLGWKGYFLHFGAIEPKKNLGRIVEAYLASGVTTPLVIVGGRAWLDEGETRLLDQVKRDGGPHAERIRRYEYLSYSMLVTLIRGAKATIFPSLYEGFGLPVLESMALKTAVLTSTGGALPEVAGNAALSVDPYDTVAITRGIQSLDRDEDLRAELVTRGIVQAAKFSPAIYQERLRELYAKVGVSTSASI